MKVSKVVARCAESECGAPLRSILFRDEKGRPICARCQNRKTRAVASRSFEERVVRKGSTL